MWPFFLCSPQTGCCRMAPFLEAAHRLGWILLKALLRFTFMFINNCVAIPSYCLYLIVLQPLRIMDSQTFWYIEGVMFRWLLAMVASWGWFAGYTGKDICFKYCTPKIKMHQAGLYKAKILGDGTICFLHGNWIHTCIDCFRDVYPIQWYFFLIGQVLTFESQFSSECPLTSFRWH